MTGQRLHLGFSRPLTEKERRSFEKRRTRLDGAFGKSARSVLEVVKHHLYPLGQLPVDGLRVRSSFCYLQEPISDDLVSDRSAPDRALRPSATRISTSQGAALRLYLTALAVAQISSRSGGRFSNEIPLSTTSRTELAWTDLVASSALPSGEGSHKASIRDKKVRTLSTALDSLEAAGLVERDPEDHTKGTWRKRPFRLLDEAGQQLPGDPMPYGVPAETDDYFALPAGFVTNGWLHLLADSEITLILMVACGLGALTPDPWWGINPGEVAVPGDVRLRRYGIHRDPFSAARKTLAWFGLLNAREVARHPDGRGEDGKLLLHRLSLSRNAFDTDAFEAMREAIARQLQRSSQGGTTP